MELAAAYCRFARCGLLAVPTSTLSRTLATVGEWCVVWWQILFTFVRLLPAGNFAIVAGVAEFTARRAIMQTVLAFQMSYQQIQ